MSGGTLGEIFAALAFSGAMIAALSYLFAARTDGLQKKTWESMAKWGWITHGVSVFGVIGTLFYLIYTHQYQYHYVWDHSSNELQVEYMISCFWEGQEGSFLLWTFWHVILGGIVMWKVNVEWRNVVMSVIASVNLILSSMILGVYIPEGAALILFVIGMLVPFGYLLWRFLQHKDSFRMNRLVHVAGLAMGLAGLGIVITGKSGFFSLGEIPKYFSLQNSGYLLMSLMLIGFVGLMIYAVWRAFRDNDIKEISTMEFFSAIMLGGFAYIAASAEFDTWKIGSSPFILLKDVFKEAPIFASDPDFIPSNGRGLNSLLQNYWMVIHPPTLFLGFASTVVPFAFVIGGLVTRRYSEWIKPAAPWTIFSVMILGVGIIMGGYWAYETLNFGGYWNWDPVENSSFVPWILGIAALHAMVAYRKSKAFLKFTMILVMSTFILVLYSTFLTRSGILGETSVHTFTDLGLSGQLLLLLFIYLFGLLALFVGRSKAIPVARRNIAFNSTEFVIFLGVLTLLFAGIAITIFTSIPVFNQILGTNWATPKDGPFFYYRWTIWFAVIMAILSGIGQFMYWKRRAKKSVRAALLRPYGVAIVLTVAIVVGLLFSNGWEFGFEERYREWKELADLSGNVVSSGFRYLRIGVYIFADEILLFAALFMVAANLDILIHLLRKNARTRAVTGGSIAHVGFGLILIGILFSSGYDQVISKNVNPNELAALPQDARIDNVMLEKHRPRNIIGYQVTYTGKKEAEAPISDLHVIQDDLESFKVRFRDKTGDEFGFIMPKGVFVKEDGSINLEFVEEFLNDKLKFLKPKHINERTLYGVKFVPRKKDGETGEVILEEDKGFTLYPEAEVNETMGLIAHPSRKIHLGYDIYVHVSTIPKEEEEPRYKFYNFDLAKGDTVQTARSMIIFESITSEPTEGTNYELIAQANLRIMTDNGWNVHATEV
ncbi:MAG: cytochrome c biogenesis protein CcsA [Bacteroidota bacterium]